MSEKKKRAGTYIALGCLAALTLLGVLLLLTKSFVIQTVLHIFVRMLAVLLVIKILKKKLP